MYYYYIPESFCFLFSHCLQERSGSAAELRSDSVDLDQWTECGLWHAEWSVWVSMPLRAVRYVAAHWCSVKEPNSCMDTSPCLCLLYTDVVQSELHSTTLTTVRGRNEQNKIVQSLRLWDQMFPLLRQILRSLLKRSNQSTSEDIYHGLLG